MDILKKMKYGAVILAGGQGTRFGCQKQFLNLCGKELWKHVYDKVIDVIGKDNVVVVGMDVPGGATRTQSVINGLKSLDKDTDRVLLVEAARPLVTVDQLEMLIKDCAESTTFVMPLVNTVIGRDGKYMNRNELYEMLTPQAFNYKKLSEALNSGKYYDYTDETRIMFEHFGIKPHFIETTPNLIKVTYPRDILIIEAMINDRKGW